MTIGKLIDKTNRWINFDTIEVTSEVLDSTLEVLEMVRDHIEKTEPNSKEFVKISVVIEEIKNELNN